MAKTEKMTDDQRKGLRAKLRWTSDEFDIDPIRGPHSEDPDGRWIIRVSLGKRSLILRQPTRGHILVDMGERGRGKRPSTHTSDPNEAIRRAEKLLYGKRERALFEAGLDAAVKKKRNALTVSDVGRLLRRTKLVNKATWKKYLRAGRIASWTFGPSLPIKAINQHRLEEAIAKRMAGIPELGLGRVGPVTAVNTFRDFATCITHVSRLEDGAYNQLIDANPFGKVVWPKEVEVVEDGRTEKKRVVKKKRDPFKLHQLLMLVSPFIYTGPDDEEVTLPAPVDVVDPTGALRLIILIAMFTGRRFEAILRLQVEDLVFDLKRMREVLEGADEECRRDWAEHFVHGMIDFRRRWDKESHHWAVPICSTLRPEIHDYLQRRDIKSGPLFPAAHDPTRSLAQSVISKNPWKDPKTGRLKIGRFDRAWRIARKYLERAGQDPDGLMPIRSGYKIHRIRAFFATHLEKLGYGKANVWADGGHNFDDHANYIGSWALDNSVKSDSYIPLDPAILMGVVEWMKADEVLGRRADLERERATRAKDKIAAARPAAISSQGASGAA